MVIIIILTKDEAKTLKEILEEWYDDHKYEIYDFEEARKHQKTLYDRLMKLLEEQLRENKEKEN